MKLKPIILCALACACELLTGCEVIREDNRLVPADSSQFVSNALLIDFTGFTCVNCPLAAEEAHKLQKAFDEHLVVVAMHPADNHFTQTGKPEYDYTCPEANEYYRYFGGTSTTPFPTGIIDMQQGFQDYTTWATAVLNSVTTKKSGKISLDINDVDEANRQFSVSADVAVEHLAGETDNEAMVELLLWLVADSVQGAQMMPDGSTNLSYTHRHQLRACLFDNPWGIYPGIVTGNAACRVATIRYQVTDTIGGKVLPLKDYSVVGVLLDPASKQLIDVQQKKIVE